MKRKIQILLLFHLLILAVTNSSCAMNPFKKQLPTTPYALPIDISKKGNKAEVDLRIKTEKERAELESGIIAFEMKFFWQDPRKSKSLEKMFNGIKIDNFFVLTAFQVVTYPIYWVIEGRKYDKKYTKEEKNEIWQDYRRVEKLVGYYNGGSFDEKGKWDDNIVKGLPIPNIRITIIDINGVDKKVVYDEILEVKKHPNKVGYFDKFLEYIKLNPGNYKIIAEVQSDALEFKGTEIKIIIGSHRVKV